MFPEFVLAALLVFLQKEILCLKDVVLDIEPTVVTKGGESTLKCSYDLQGAPLYTVKWYRGRHEFYRYTPKEHPSTKIFPFEGVHVDLKQSNEHQVVLRDVGFNLSGKFSCEVTADAPLFTTVTESKNMSVVVFPSSAPSLSTDKSVYDIGDVLRANCTSSPSRPPATLTFVLNNVVVCEKCEPRKNSSGDLSRSSLSLELPLFPSHFLNDRLTLKCVAKFGDFFLQDTEITFRNTIEPVPARVTQSSANHYRSNRFVVGFVVLYVFLLQYLVYY